MKIKISQSLLKGLLNYRKGNECGLLFQEKYLKGRYDLFPPSDVQNVGAWFEYIATGSVPKNGEVPKPEYMARKKDEKGNPELATAYKLMKSHIENFKKMMAVYGFEIIRVGEDIKVLYPNSVERFGVEVWLTGTLDIRAIATRDIYTIDKNRFRILVAKKGQEVIIDLKTTGLLDDKWNDYGWELENLDNKVNLVTQPIHYKYIELLKTGVEPPFIFMLYSSKNPNDARIIDFKVDESAFTEHENFIDAGVLNLLNYQEKGFKPLPSLLKCSECPLKEDCEYRAIVPPISVFYYGQNK